MLQELKSKLCPNVNDTLRSINCLAINGQVCFHRWLFADPVRPCWCIKGPVGPLGSTNQNCVPDCCQWLSRSILWFVYFPVVCWEQSTTVCGLMAERAHLRLAYPPLPPPAPSHPPTSL